MLEQNCCPLDQVQDILSDLVVQVVWVTPAPCKNILPLLPQAEVLYSCSSNHGRCMTGNSIPGCYSQMITLYRRDPVETLVPRTT